jgi:2-polyprenyl-3-methyl-5-hydroxy-6-metoxy-1,4-benzoquinol methylase
MAKGINTAETTDEQFVANLYRNLLQRSPNIAEVKHWTGVLGTGVKRSDIVEVFMSSSEFITLQSQRDRFHISSLSGAEGPQHEQEILSILQTHVARQQNIGYEANVMAESEEADRESEEAVCEPEEGLREVEAPAITKLSSQLWETKDAVGQLNPRNFGPLNYLAQAAKKALQRSLTWYTRSLHNFHFQVAKALEDHGNDINSLDRSLRRVDTEMLRLGSGVSRLDHKISKLDNRISRVNHEISRLDDEILKLQAGYLQELLRANELATQERLIPYVDFFRESSPVLDIGCGRGDFLLLLKETGIPSYGVDSDETAVEAGRRKSLRVIKENLLEHLRQLPDRSLGGIFSARVVEFLPAHAQMELIALCSMKIRSGGVLIIETTNPDSGRGYGRTSYLDPTHLLAIPPELMKSAFESNCFRDVKITVLAPVEEALTQVLSADSAVSRSERRARVLPEVGNRLTVSPVYAAVGWRS